MSANPPLLSCKQCAEILPDIVDGTASAELIRRVLWQTEQRARCKACYESYLMSIKLARHAFIDQEPEGLYESLRTFLHARVGEDFGSGLR